ncbi:LOW QUALITY PROTEIN: hypothetical protein V2J09_011125 [Rumex salicifolius]
MWEARSFLEKGLGWRVGDGTSIRVWRDRWIRENNSREPITKAPPAQSDMRVSKLIDQHTRSWKADLVIELFLPFEARRVKSIPLSCLRCPDKKIWFLEKYDEYTVKSAYHLFNEESEYSPLSSSSRPGLDVWGKIWASQVTPRVKMHAWSICNKTLPTNLRLANRMQDHNALCPCCGEGNEIDIHMLRRLHSKAVWEQAEFNVTFLKGEGIDWIHDMGKQLRREFCNFPLWALEYPEA